MHENDLIIVGNGPSVLRHEYGRTINTFGTVVRFNHYEVNGLEKHVGNKTDVWFTYRAFRRNFLGINEIIQAVVGNVRLERQTEELQKLCKSRHVKFTEVSHEVIEMTYENMGHFEGIQKPTSGMVALTYFIFGENLGPVYAVGFDCGCVDQKFHYFSTQTVDPGAKYVNAQIEKKYFQNLVDLGHVKLLGDKDE